MHPVMVGPVKVNPRVFLEGLFLLCLAHRSVHGSTGPNPTGPDTYDGEQSVIRGLVTGMAHVRRGLPPVYKRTSNPKGAGAKGAARVPQRVVPAGSAAVDPWSSSFVGFRPTPTDPSTPDRLFPSRRTRRRPSLEATASHHFSSARYSGSRAAAQRKPANSRATATTTSCLLLPREISRK